MDLPTLLGNAHAAQIWRSALARQKGVFFAGTVAALEQNKASAVVHAGQAERVAEMLWKQCSDVLGPEQLLHGMPSAAIVDAGDGSVASWVDVSVDKVRWLPPRQPHKTDTSSVVVEYLCVALDKRRRGLGIVQLAEALYQTMRYRPGIRRVNLNTVTGLLFRNMEFYLKAGFRYDLTDLLVTMAGEGPGERIAFAVINQTGQSAVVPAMLTGRIYRDKAKDIAPVVAKIVQQRPSLGAWFDVEHRGFLKAELVDAIRENRVGWMRVDDADLRWIILVYVSIMRVAAWGNDPIPANPDWDSLVDEAEQLAYVHVIRFLSSTTQDTDQGTFAYGPLYIDLYSRDGAVFLNRLMGSVTVRLVRWDAFLPIGSITTTNARHLRENNTTATKAAYMVEDAPTTSADHLDVRNLSKGDLAQLNWTHRTTPFPNVLPKIANYLERRDSSVYKLLVHRHLTPVGILALQIMQKDGVLVKTTQRFPN